MKSCLPTLPSPLLPDVRGFGTKDAGLLANEDFHTFVIALVSRHCLRFSPDLFTRLVNHIAQLSTIITNVGHFKDDDQMEGLTRTRKFALNGDVNHSFWYRAYKKEYSAPST